MRLGTSPAGSSRRSPEVQEVLMIRNLAERIVEWQIKKHFLPDEDRGLYQYAYEVLLNQVINVLIAILIAVLFRAPMPVFLFLASYIPLRSYCGGHHARTNGGCTAVSAVLLCIICVIYRILPSNAGVIMQPVSYIISGLLIIRFAPVENVNKPLAEEERVRYRKISRYIWFGESLVGMSLFFIKSPAGVVIALSHTVLCVMLYWGKVIN
ncbi:hypothetical protein ADH76_33180 [Enterocloster clostridioformis]|nr:hypothetical protein A4V08_27895 [Lachnoclostridium sp. YL32]NDO27140.1 hypothetical protein [Enterocloster clostridioformis]OXE61970.1 hypothetical protein ADH76_33180 [Enterocloster clostridioformis]